MELANLFEKMAADHWGNVLMLSNGNWMPFDGIEQIFEYNGEKWIEVTCVSEFDSDHLNNPFMRSKKINTHGLRRIVFNMREIAFAAEYSS